ncbi:hypothetical protein EOPP23_05590 [Endozoicomonas sp. OPT23]|uniref:AraC family transcriptional regulator n=1 Tax=Endozoicomonas sp. OPT23 TaxID=2072845 RepID=UPI00129AFF2D|nr:helix-turn-helix domain-containing protein [Endozoicomonas sp. OPT23]MRI32457.1 hypothetical protein [Endozoicomonas sp. OPT23]
MESSLAKAARNIYLFFIGRSDIAQLKLSMEYLHITAQNPRFNYRKPADQPSEGTPLENGFSELMLAIDFKKILNQWHEIFDRKTGISDAEANNFIKQLFSALEVDNPFFSYQNVVNNAARKKNTWTDFHIIRPKLKAGWTLHLTLEGSGQYNLIRNTIRTSPGEIILLSPSAYLDVKRADNCDEWVYQSVMFQADANSISQLQWPEIAPDTYHLKVPEMSDLNRISAIIQCIDQQGWSTHPLDIKTRAAGITMLLSQCGRIAGNAVSQQVDPRIQAAMGYIDENLCQSITIEQVARVACLSPSGLAIQFKKHHGVSVMQWREERRIANACKELLTTHKKVSAIAEELGYVSPMYFSRCFSKYMNISPSEYRKQQSGM